MILHALYDYYERKSADPDAHMAPPGFEWKEIPFVVEIDERGNLIQVENTRYQVGSRRRAREYLVPQDIGRSSNLDANLLWDKASYSLGVNSKTLPDRLRRQKEKFVERITSVFGDCPVDMGVSAVLNYLRAMDLHRLSAGNDWADIVENDPAIAFKLAGDLGLVCQRDNVLVKITGADQDDSADGICLVTGEVTQIATKHQKTPILGAKSNAKLISFNDPAYNSYNKAQGENAPIGKRAAFGYTTALNHLLRKDSAQKLQIGGSIAVFWSDKSTELETGIVDIFGEPTKDDPDRNTRAVVSLYKAIDKGLLENDEGKVKFFALGLAPNAARIAIRFWHHGTVADMAARIRQHFDDLAIERAPHDPPYLSLFRLLVSVATLGKADNIPPNLGGELMRSVLADLPYPQTLLAAAVRRIRAEQEVTYPRAALIKACINRATRYSNPNVKEELKMSLDESNTNAGYRLGRLFAVLEKIQEEANPGINSTIRDRYYGAASATPVTVFSTLLKLKNHHITKLDNRGRAVNLEKRIGEIMDGIHDFPAQLQLADQGRFAIGYYHQRQEFFKKHDTSTEGE